MASRILPAAAPIAAKNTRPILCRIGLHPWQSFAVTPTEEHGQVLGMIWRDVLHSQECRCGARREITRTQWSSSV